LRSLELEAAGDPEAGRALMPEEAWITRALGEALGVEGPEEAAASLEALEARLDLALLRIEEASPALDAHYAALRIRLLERFPFVDDPWHEGFDALLTRHADEL